MLNNPVLSLKEFKDVYNALYRPLCLFANSYVNDVPVAKDIVQDVFVKIWENEIILKSKNPSKGYFYTSVKHKCIDYLKSKQFRVVNKDISVESLNVLESDKHFNKEVILIETSQIIEKAINSLPEKYSQIVNLSMKNFSNKEIAEILSLNINTVKAQKKVAYQKLRPLLKEYYYFFIIFFIQS